MERLAPRAGQRLLDVGCGGGSTSLALAQRVLPGGSVVGVDIAPAMVARASERAAGAGLGNLSFVVADAAVHDFGRQAFDGAYSRFGVMFFADPEPAFANIRAATLPGGRLSFACWQGPEANEWMTLPARAVVAALGLPAPTPSASGDPGPFALADRERLGRILQAAGYHDVEIDPVNDPFEVAEEEIPLRARVSTRQGLTPELLAGADDATLAQAVGAIERALRDRLVGATTALARGALIVTATA
jgi:SAM-dependent methyltransferase